MYPLVQIEGDGEGVNVYVIDTGIRVSHEDFQGRAKAAYDVFGEDVSIFKPW